MIPSSTGVCDLLKVHSRNIPNYSLSSSFSIQSIPSDDNVEVLSPDFKNKLEAVAFSFPVGA